MNILITGGAGYIGSIMVPFLLEQGHRVTVIDNFLYGQASLLDCCHRPELTILRGDARNRDLVARAIKGVDAIFPLACLVGAPLCDKLPLEAQSINYDAVKMILELRSSSQIILFPTTNSGYGIGEKGDHVYRELPHESGFPLWAPEGAD